MIELTIQEACKQPANFLYIWADEQAFLQYINPKYAAIIRGKKANQRKLLLLSAQKYRKTLDDYTSAIRQAFINTYDITPADALIALARGETVAGKNWAKGTFGVGALHVSEFAGATVNGQKVTVDKSTGHIYAGAEDITDKDYVVYAEVGKKTVAYQLYSRTVEGKTFGSLYNSTLKKYYANTYSDETGTIYNARTGSPQSATDSASMWGDVLLSLETFLNWLLSLFGLGGDTSNTERISSENTLPSQKTDGFVQESGFGEAGMIALLAVGAGTLLAGGFGGSNKKSK